MYLHPHHIDLVVGGFAEKSFKKGLLGRTFQGIVGSQFRDLKNGDRFFFTHQGQMSRREKKEIFSRSLGDIICDNTGIKKVPTNVFEANSPLIDCNHASQMDIAKFQVFKANNNR